MRLGRKVAVPSYQDFMLPILRILSDGNQHRISDLYDEVAQATGLGDVDRAEMLASGKQTRFENRVGWAKTYLQKAGLVESPKRGSCFLTERGRGVLDQAPSKIDLPFL